MGLDEGAGGLIVTVSGVGTMLALVVVRLADRWGRRRTLSLTILGYAVFTGLTGLSQSAVDFALYQLAARIFLIAEWAIAMVYAAEEFPAERRGFVIGVIQAANALGAIVCAGVVPLLLDTAYGWRTVYFVGVVPLLLLAYARRDLRETQRFAAHQAVAGTRRRSILDIMRSPYRRRVLQLALIWALTYVATQNAVIFWKEFAVAERGMSDAAVGTAIALASLGSLPLVFLVGKVLDVLGRRRSAILIYGVATVSILAAYQLHSYWALTAALTLAIFGAVALLSLLNTFTTELFPTAMRGDAFAWANNLLGRIGYVISPVLVGHAAEVIGWGTAVSVTVVFPVAALALILWLLPETSGLELEETARL